MATEMTRYGHLRLLQWEKANAKQLCAFLFNDNPDNGLFAIHTLHDKRG